MAHRNDERDAALPARIGPYGISRKLGEGGMGVVYAAHDERLERPVAVKTLSSVGRDETARRRFWREARAAASVSHPNICHIYEIGEDPSGELFIAMELLEGESLAARLERGPLSVSEAIPIALGMLSALSALHTRGIVHRDLKPSNVFLTPHGVKLLDFGLARPGADASLDTATALTFAGVLVGTPRYMAPEQVTAGAVDARGDLFAAGAILFEMLAGRPAFTGRNAVEILHATLHEQPPALTGSPAVAAMDRVLRRALAKRPEQRPASAEAMAQDLRAVSGAEGGDAPTLAQALTRLVVLPFRMLRRDADIDFLAFSLADAIATSLSGIGSLVVRSSAVAARFVQEVPDLKLLAADADVDCVVMGTLLRSGDQVRASAQLVEVPAGTMLTSLTVQAPLGDLFRLQDDITRRVVEALALPLSRGSQAPPSAPHDARAYELYLRANEVARTYDGLPRARELYERCVEIDPGFAPAWARLGRCHRVIGKYIDGAPDSEARAEAAFRRALELSPRLTIAHKFYANLEADIGEARRAVVRLIQEASRHGNDPELFAGLVHACRYCGLFEQSIAAHAEARRLDPHVPTGLEQTYLLMLDVDGIVSVDAPPRVAGADDGIRVIALGLSGRRDDARRALLRMRETSRIPAFESWIEHLGSWLDRRVDEMLASLERFRDLKIWQDPEAVFQEGWLFCDAGAPELGLEFLQRAVASGYSVAPTLVNAPHFDPLRSNPAFQALLADAVAGRDLALAAFRESDGERLLGR